MEVGLLKWCPNLTNAQMEENALAAIEAIYPDFLEKGRTRRQECRKAYSARGALRWATWPRSPPHRSG